MTSTFTVITRTRHAAERLFDLSLSIDEHLGSMAKSGEQAIAGVTSGQIGLGETVTWRARHFGLWFTMTSRITALERPHRFVDEQTSGPFAAFRHVHTFEQSPDSEPSRQTVMTDNITVASPVFGRMAERLVLVPYLRRLIAQRNHHLVRHLDAHS
ncbi:cyclase [Citricoccus sp. GCM10030269]|uniref:SRPBCC family protein n=1 Tax=Citricoccus sp. GCM10030269 TaxID=3273388 RepID=UPI003622E438